MMRDGLLYHLRDISRCLRLPKAAPFKFRVKNDYLEMCWVKPFPLPEDNQGFHEKFERTLISNLSDC